MDSTNLQKTPLYALHQEYGAKFAPFAGYEMPIQYASGSIKEHLHCRHACGLFDVSHMGQVEVFAPATLLEQIQTAPLQNLALSRTRYGLFTNEQGGILDDMMVSRLGDEHFFFVVNAACKHQDTEILAAHCGQERLKILNNHALLALQGPQAEQMLASHVPEAKDMRFMQTLEATIASHPCRISRLGYTGEDGYEISLDAAVADEIARLLLTHAEVLPIGLAARDSLRLEAGLCLYGSDIDTQTTPIEANLAFALGKHSTESAQFPGASAIFAQKDNGTAQRARVGFTISGKSPIRGGAEIFDGDNCIGMVTSGGYSPCLEQPIAMGYVASEYAEQGRKLTSKLRGKDIDVQICDPIFVPHRYRR